MNRVVTVDGACHLWIVNDEVYAAPVGTPHPPNDSTDPAPPWTIVPRSGTVAIPPVYRPTLKLIEPPPPPDPSTNPHREG